MSDTIQLEIPSRITTALKRMMHLRESGYLPPKVEDDLMTLMEAAMCWELYEQQKYAKHIP